MGKLPRVTAAQLLRALKRMGFQEIRRKGSHLTLCHPEKDKVLTIPMHPRRTIPPKTLKSILKQGGIEVEELKKFL